MTLFSTDYNYTIDVKNRINFKKLLKRLDEDDRKFTDYYLVKQQRNSVVDGNKKYPFFYLYSKTAWEEFYKKMQISEKSFEERMQISQLFGEASLDSSERLSFPKKFTDFISVKKDVVLHGDGDKIQVWSKEVYDEYISETSKPTADTLTMFN